MTLIVNDASTAVCIAAPCEVVMVVNMLISGGAEKQMLWIAETLATEGHRVTVFEMVAPSSVSRIDSLVARAAGRGVSFVRAARGDGYVGAWWRLRELRQREGRVAYLTWGLRADLIIAFHRLLMRPPKLFWVSSLRNANREAISSYHRLYRWMDRAVGLYVANTRANCEMLAEFCPSALARCRVMPNVVEELAAKGLELPAAVPRPLQIVMLGNIDVLRKGYDVMIAVARLLKRDVVAAEIHVAGRRDAAGWIEAQIKEHRLEQVVIYHGETTRPTEFLRRGHAYMLLSRHEGMPNAMLEALALGLPTMATRVGDLERMAGDQRPYQLVDIGSADQVLAAIKAMVHDWPAALAMGQRGRDWCAQNFSAASCRQRLVSLLDEVDGKLRLNAELR